MSPPPIKGSAPTRTVGLITLLLQDDQGGLQVETPRGWIDVPPRPDTFVINIGELLELASDGFLRATMHRVLTLPVGDPAPIGGRSFSVPASMPSCRGLCCRPHLPPTPAVPSGIRGTLCSVRWV